MFHLCFRTLTWNYFNHFFLCFSIIFHWILHIGTTMFSQPCHVFATTSFQVKALICAPKAEGGKNRRQRTFVLWWYEFIFHKVSQSPWDNLGNYIWLWPLSNGNPNVSYMMLYDMIFSKGDFHGYLDGHPSLVPRWAGKFQVTWTSW